jgi:hypothetical protein
MTAILEQMLSGLNKEIDNALSTLPKNAALSRRSFSKSKIGVASVSQKSIQKSSQIVQTLALPLTLKLSEFKDALSNANPSGDIIAAQKFQQLVDPAPDLANEYMTSTSSIEDLYGGIVHGAVAPADSSYLTSMIADAKRNFDTSAQADFVSVGEWRLIEANPYDWYTDNASRYKKANIALDGQSNFLGEESSPTMLTIADKQIPLSKATNLTQCKLEYMLVRFIRPWMDFTLFKTSGWWLADQPPGFCSSGSREINTGILPLITTGMILARSAEFEGDWDPEDQKKIDELHAANEGIHIGPYKLHDKSKPVSTVNVVAWISELVPFSPQIAQANDSSTLQFKNQGTLKVICVVRWELKGETLRTRALITAGNSDKIIVPDNAKNVAVIIHVKKGTQKKLAFRKKYATLPSKSYVIKGTFEKILVEED